MGTTSWPCPSCGQAQTEIHENGHEVALRLCAACQEKADAESAEGDAKEKKRR